MLPHVGQEREASLVKEQFKLLQNEDIPDEWIQDSDGKLKRIDMYWANVFDIKSGLGEQKCYLLSRVVKSCLVIQNSNAGVERSLSDNKNTVTPERTHLSDDTIMGLRRLKEPARHLKGVHNINTLSYQKICSKVFNLPTKIMCKERRKKKLKD